MMLDLNKTYMRGSELSPLNIESIYPMILLVPNFTGLYDVYLNECLNNFNCSNIMVDDAKIINDYYSMVNCDHNGEPPNNKEVEMDY